MSFQPSTSLSGSYSSDHAKQIHTGELELTEDSCGARTFCFANVYGAFPLLLMGTESPTVTFCTVAAEDSLSPTATPPRRCWLHRGNGLRVATFIRRNDGTGATNIVSDTLETGRTAHHLWAEASAKITQVSSAKWTR